MRIMRASSWRRTRSGFAMALLLVVTHVTGSLAGHSSAALATDRLSRRTLPADS